jgi:uridine kinase
VPGLLSMDDALEQAICLAPGAIVAVDGLPCAGKSTLAERIADRRGCAILGLDDFVLPQEDWPQGIKPAFPFPFVRYDAFLAAVATLAKTGECAYRPFDWDRLTLTDEPRVVRRDNGVVVEGVSALNAELCDLYDLRVFIESDSGSIYRAAMDRGDGLWAREWRELFLPSTDLYMATDPAARADLVVAGRGADADAGPQRGLFNG